MCIINKKLDTKGLLITINEEFEHFWLEDFLSCLGFFGKKRNKAPVVFVCFVNN